MEGGKRDLQCVKETATNANGELTQNKTNYGELRKDIQYVRTTTHFNYMMMIMVMIMQDMHYNEHGNSCF